MAAAWPRDPRHPHPATSTHILGWGDPAQPCQIGQDPPAPKKAAPGPEKSGVEEQQSPAQDWSGERNCCGLGVRDSDEMLSTGRGAGCDPTAPGDEAGRGQGRLWDPTAAAHGPGFARGSPRPATQGKKKKDKSSKEKKANCKQGFNLCSVAACTRHGVGSDCCRNLGCTMLGRAPGAARPRPLPRAGLLAEPASSSGVLGVAGSPPPRTTNSPSPS